MCVCVSGRRIVATTVYTQTVGIKYHLGWRTKGRTHGFARVIEKWPTVMGWKSSSLGYMSRGERVWGRWREREWRGRGKGKRKGKRGGGEGELEEAMGHTYHHNKGKWYARPVAQVPTHRNHSWWQGMLPIRSLRYAGCVRCQQS